MGKKAGWLAPGLSPRAGRVAEEWERGTEISSARRNKALEMPEGCKKNQDEDKSREGMRLGRDRIEEDAQK